MKKLTTLLIISLFATNLAYGANSNKPEEINVKPAIYLKNKSNQPLTEKDYEKLKKYKNCTKSEDIMIALYTMEDTLADFARRAILGENLSGRPIKVQFKNLAEIKPEYHNYDAIGWKIKDRLYIFVNEKHKNAPPEALASLLSHEAMHQDSFNSINEETYSWTMEAAVWTDYLKKNPSLKYKTDHPLVRRLNTLNDLFVKANYTDKYIKKVVQTNDGYKDLPVRSPGFEQ